MLFKLTHLLARLADCAHNKEVADVLVQEGGKEQEHHQNHHQLEEEGEEENERGGKEREWVYCVCVFVRRYVYYSLCADGHRRVCVCVCTRARVFACACVCVVFVMH